MKLNQLSLSFSSDEISRAVKTAASRAAGVNAQVPSELADLNIEIRGGHLVVSTKKKVGFMPVTISAEIAIKPLTDGNGIIVTLARISAGFIGSEAIAAQVLSQVGRSLTGVPGCSVSGNDITLTKDALAAKAPWISIPGKINRFDVVDDRLEISIG